MAGHMLDRCNSPYKNLLYCNYRLTQFFIDLMIIYWLCIHCVRCLIGALPCLSSLTKPSRISADSSRGKWIKAFIIKQKVCAVFNYVSKKKKFLIYATRVKVHQFASQNGGWTNTGVERWAAEKWWFAQKRHYKVHSGQCSPLGTFTTSVSLCFQGGCL